MYRLTRSSMQYDLFLRRTLWKEAFEVWRHDYAIYAICIARIRYLCMGEMTSTSISSLVGWKSVVFLLHITDSFIIDDKMRCEHLSFPACFKSCANVLSATAAYLRKFQKAYSCREILLARYMEVLSAKFEVWVCYVHMYTQVSECFFRTKAI